MKAKDKFLSKMLKTALAMEEKGCKMYLKIAQATDNSLVKRVFDTLAKDETLHIKAIKRFYLQSLKPLAKLNIVKLLKAKTNKKKKKEIFGVATKKWQKDLSLTKSDQAAYKFALDFESKGYEFYQRALSKTKEEKVRKLLTFLTKQENEHYRLLQETHEYLIHPTSWFIKEEKPIYEGG